jgi:hypothetical protein
VLLFKVLGGKRDTHLIWLSARLYGWRTTQKVLLPL